MNSIRVTSLSLFFTCLTLVGISQPYPCDGRLILSAVNTNTATFNITFARFRSIYYSQMASYLGERFDAVGFNPKDNYIYGFQEASNSFVRLHINGSYDVIGSVPQAVDSLKVYAGDCTPEGQYICHEDNLDKLLVFNVVDQFELVQEIDLFWSPASQNSGPFTTRIDDLVVDPNNSKIAYAFQGHFPGPEFEPAGTKGFLLKINLDFTDPNVGMVTPLFLIPEDTILHIESLFFTNEGQLYGIGPHITVPFLENRIISINPGTATSAIEGLTAPPATKISDGCSCPYSLAFQNDIVPRDFSCSDTTVNFVLTLTNDSYQNITGVTLADTLPEEMIIREVSNSFVGEIVSGTGVGTGLLNIENLVIPPKSTVEIIITAEVIDIPEWLVLNQAYLTNLPPLFGGFKLSDEPRTPELLGDPSGFISTPVILDDVDVQIFPPSNCLNANDGRITVSSPILMPGDNFKVVLENEDYEETTYDIVIDNENSFTIENLLAGEYIITRITLENSRCSYSWEEKSILIEAPNHLLEVTALTNSPICEGESLELSGTVSPAGTVSWSGPEGFVSTELNSSVPAVPKEYSGMFEMEATYGFCSKTIPNEVFIAPKIEAEIIGEIEYCERAPMILSAKGVGENLSVNWTGPNFSSTNPELKIPSLAAYHEGDYQVIMDNGYCKDSVLTRIDIFPSPTIHLPKLIETDFCTPLKLNPIITGDDAVTYSWTRSRGLSCYNCPTPTLEVPFGPTYQLTVINDYMCADTSIVQVVLNKENLFFAPNAFSPNFDGRNDYFQIFPYCGINRIKNLAIFNRWGAMVYENDKIDSLDPQSFWNGRIGDQTAPPGVYIWQVELDLVDGTTLRYFGDISLVK